MAREHSRKEIPLGVRGERGPVVLVVDTRNLVFPSGAIRCSIETDMANRESLRRTTRDLVALSHSDLDFVALREQAAERLRRALPFDSYCWLTLDPASLLPTSCVADHSLDYLPRALENELFDDDFN